MLNMHVIVQVLAPINQIVHQVMNSGQLRVATMMVVMMMMMMMVVMMILVKGVGARGGSRVLNCFFFDEIGYSQDYIAF